MTISHITTLTPHNALSEQGKTEAAAPELFGGDGFGFDDLVDMVNPLQHVPGISHIYRAATGDQLSSAAQIVGGGLFGGVFGAAAGAATAIAEGISGESVLDTALSVIDGSAFGDDAIEVTKTQHYAGVATSPLQADNGEALLSMLQSGAFTHQKEVIASKEESNAPKTVKELHLRDTRDAALGLTDSNKGTQLRSGLHKTATELL